MHEPRLPHLLHAQEDPDRPQREGQDHPEVRSPVLVKGLILERVWTWGKSLYCENEKRSPIYKSLKRFNSSLKTGFMKKEIISTIHFQNKYAFNVWTNT